MPDPFLVLKTSLRALPQVMKWAMGVAGLAAIVAIVKIGWALDPRVAVFGTVIVILLMVAVVIFSRVPEADAAAFGLPVRVLVWSSLVLLLATAMFLFTSAFFDWPLNFRNAGSPLVRDGATYTPTKGDPTAWELKTRVNTLRGSWEALERYPNTRLDILERATKLSQELLKAPNDDLGLSGRIIKRQYACYALIMAGSVENDLDKRTVFIDRAIVQCNQALALHAEVVSQTDPSQNHKYVAAWISQANEGPFTTYLLAMATCISSTLPGRNAAKPQAAAILKRIPNFYLERYPPEQDLTLRDCVT
jgi:hypothetical protein